MIKGAGVSWRNQRVVATCTCGCGQVFHPAYGDVRLFYSSACANRDARRRRSPDERRRIARAGCRAATRKRQQAFRAKLRDWVRRRAWRQAYRAIYAHAYRRGREQGRREVAA